jgi:hypothetical protein
MSDKEATSNLTVTAEQQWHTNDIDYCAQKTQSNIEDGLTTTIAEERKLQYGPNELTGDEVKIRNFC